jgi:hypothetical protein
VKINVKPKIEATDQYNLRMPASLKKRLESLKTRANDLGADFNATLVGMIEEFATALEARFDEREQSVRTSPGTNPNKVLGQPTPPTDANNLSPVDRTSTPNGADPERA